MAIADKKREVSAAKLMDEFIGVAVAEEIASREGETRESLIRKLAEGIPVDLSQIIYRTSLIEEELKEVVDLEAYQRIFLSLWLAQLPGAYRAVFEKGVGRKVPMFLDLREYVLGMGSKMKSVRTGLLCVAPTAAPVCAECYFEKACRLKRS